MKQTIQVFEDHIQYMDWHKNTTLGWDTNNDGAKSYWQETSKKWRVVGGDLNLAKAAFLELYPEMLRNNRHADIEKIWGVLYEGMSNIGEVEPSTQGERLWDTRTIQYNFFPSMIENPRHRKSFVKLVDYVHQGGAFKEGYASRIDVASKLFQDYVVIDVGAKQNLALSKRELREANMTPEQVVESLPYMMTFFEKQGHKLIPFPEGDYEEYQLGDTSQAVIMDTILQTVRQKPGWSDANMWASFRRSSDGEGLEVIVLAGNHDQHDFETIGRYHYNKDGKNIPLIIKRADMWKMLKAAYSTHFMDTMNDPWEMGVAERRKMLPAVSWGLGLGQDTLKEKISKWFHKGIVEVDPETGKNVIDPETGKEKRKFWGTRGGDAYLSIPSWGIEVFDPRAFEYESIIKPFWEKYGHLPDKEFEEAWDMELIKNTYTFEDRHLAWWENLFKSIAAPGSLPGYGVVPHEAIDIRSLSNPFN